MLVPRVEAVGIAGEVRIRMQRAGWYRSRFFHTLHEVAVRPRGERIADAA